MTQVSLDPRIEVLDAMLRDRDLTRAWVSRRLHRSEMWVSRRFRGEVKLKDEDEELLRLAIEAVPVVNFD